MKQIQTEDIQKIMKLYAKLDKPLEIKVDGTSMLPTIKPGDVVSVKKTDKYRVGDILVFQHYKDSLTIHRLLKIHGDIYICKGDNSYNLENIAFSDIIGKISNNTDWNVFEKYLILNLSYIIGKYAKKTKYNIILVKKSIYYKIYRKYYLKI